MLFSKPLRLALSLTLIAAPFLPSGFLAGWLIGSYRGAASGITTIEFHSANIGAAIGFVFGGLGMGLVIGLMLHRGNRSFNFWHIVAVTIAWGAACAIAVYAMLSLSFLYIPSVRWSP